MERMLRDGDYVPDGAGGLFYIKLMPSRFTFS